MAIPLEGSLGPGNLSNEPQPWTSIVTLWLTTYKVALIAEANAQTRSTAETLKAVPALICMHHYWVIGVHSRWACLKVLPVCNHLKDSSRAKVYQYPTCVPYNKDITTQQKTLQKTIKGNGTTHRKLSNHLILLPNIKPCEVYGQLKTCFGGGGFKPNHTPTNHL